MLGGMCRFVIADRLTNTSASALVPQVVPAPSAATEKDVVGRSVTAWIPSMRHILRLARLTVALAILNATIPTMRAGIAAVVLFAQPSTLQADLEVVTVADGVELHYLDRGAGDPVILVHGGMNDYTTWANQIAPFAQKYRVIAYSRRYNYPNTNPVQPNYSPLVDAEDLAALLNKLHLRKVHIVGSSAGGRVALAFASRHPELVRSLVLKEVPVQFTGDPTPEALAQMDGVRQALGRGNRETAVQLILDTVSGGKTKFGDLPANSQKLLLWNLAEVEASVKNPVAPTIDREAVRKITVPVLLLSGEISPGIWKPIEEELLRLLPNAQQVVIRGGDHNMQRSQSEQFNRAVFEFLQGK